jgi:glycosidase
MFGFGSFAQERLNEEVKDHKLIVYQLLPRYFTNTNSTNKFYGSKEENGVGKFNDINEKALRELKKLGVSHVWYTGIIEHATMTDYSAYGIKMDDPDVVKGKAGSPYAIKDYYDVDPDLAVDVSQRMAEFEKLVKRTHQEGLKVIIDFIPNHVARSYHSDTKPAGVIDLGAQDDRSKAYLPSNDFYYLPGKSFVVPAGTEAGGAAFKHPLKDGKFDEDPAKVTGNNIFSEKPGIDDWYETMKLNYGWDLQNGNRAYFEPIPPVWLKMKDILSFWVKKEVDGFRCDVAQFVPSEFWHWVIPELKKINPDLIFIAEAYDASLYAKYISYGGFDYMYDKVGLYDILKRLIKNEPNGDVKELKALVKEQEGGLSNHMLRFLENHDEERIASKGFAGDPRLALPAMVVTATLSSGPVMLYYGQEVGEQGVGMEGFGGEDNRTTIFDYWGNPQHQAWLNGGKFDGGQLSEAQKSLRAFYHQLLNLSAKNTAIRSGKLIEVDAPAALNSRQYAYIRYTENERVLVVANFDREVSIDTQLVLPAAIMKAMKLGDKSRPIQDLLSGKTYGSADFSKGIPIKILPSQALILSF